MLPGPWDPGPYWLVRLCFRRGVALTYLLAFLVAARQFRPLAGEDGILPLSRYVEATSFRQRPSIFYVFDDDRTIGRAAWAGVGLSVAALLGVPSLLPLGTTATLVLSGLVWATLWALYLSFVNAGQLFYGYGWESMLLETGFLAIFMGAGSVATPAVVVWLIRWLLFRNMFGAGLIKLRGDDCWRDLTCLDYHYETQPLPNPLSWLAHHLPPWLHKLGVVVNHVVELAVPFLYFLPQPVAAAAGLVTIGFQAWLMLTGNFSWLNFLTAVLAVGTLDDDLLRGALDTLGGPALPAPAAPGAWLVFAAGVLGVVVVAFSVRPVENMLSSRQVMNTSFDPLRIVNTYGAFGSITRTRYEVVLEGTDASDPTEDDWEEYRFPGKPTDPARRPPQVAPYHLRLDWQLWFAAMTARPRRPWFYGLLGKLLSGDDDVDALLAENPFHEEPPRAVRAVRYRYRFTTPAERAESGDWWHRERVGTYVRPVTRDDPRFRRLLERYGLGRHAPPGASDPAAAAGAED